MKREASSVKHCLYPGGLQVLPELIHSGVGDAHVSEHPFQFGGELTATFRLQIEYNGTFELSFGLQPTNHNRETHTEKTNIMNLCSLLGIDRYGFFLGPIQIQIFFHQP